jgi:hypothetical protein
VARHLLALPDALSYQFIVRCRPAAPDEAIAPEPPAHLPVQAHFSAELYWDQGQGFAEQRKQVASGIIGREMQTLRFELPDGLDGLRRLKLDPADRPGILHLHALRLRCADQEQPLWHWRASEPGVGASLQSTPCHQVVWGAPLPGSAAAAVLTGDDPSIELPIDGTTLARAATHHALTVEVDLGWPMSADYLHLASVIGPLQSERQFLREQVERTVAIMQDHEKLALEHTDLHRQHADLHRRHTDLHRQHADLRQAHTELSKTTEHQSQAIHQLRAQIQGLSLQPTSCRRKTRRCLRKTRRCPPTTKSLRQKTPICPPPMPPRPIQPSSKRSNKSPHCSSNCATPPMRCTGCRTCAPSATPARWPTCATGFSAAHPASCRYPLHPPSRRRPHP